MIKSIRQSAFGAVVAAALFASAPAFALVPTDLVGMPMSQAEDYAVRTITVSPTTKSINVDYGEVVRLLIQANGGTREVLWKFDGLADAVPLSAILQAPSASAGASSESPESDTVIYVNQASNPMMPDSEE